jgi:hypothetical protein
VGANAVAEASRNLALQGDPLIDRDLEGSHHFGLVRPKLDGPLTVSFQILRQLRRTHVHRDLSHLPRHGTFSLPGRLLKNLQHPFMPQRLWHCKA